MLFDLTPSTSVLSQGQVGQVNGLCPLDGNGKVSRVYLPFNVYTGTYADRNQITPNNNDIYITTDNL